MKKVKGAAKTEFSKISIKRLKEMCLEDYTRLLARNMVETLNTKTKKSKGNARFPAGQK